MSLEMEGKGTLDLPAEANNGSQKKLKISYTRDFLLSFCELDVCKKLPTGFDRSLLSEFEDTTQDRHRISGGLPVHSLRRNDYSSSPPTRGELGNYSRGGTHGRWESRSNGRSDKDSDSQSDLDSDSGRRFGNQSWRSWQVPEHDGLLGSGSFPRPAGYAAGGSAPKFRSNDHQQLSRSNEPYHPPRPYKAGPHARRDTDSINDETFGSSDFTSDDRAEEEKKRRASFELFRKQQQKEFQDKQNNPEWRKDGFDIRELNDDFKDEKGPLDRSKKPDEPAVSFSPENDLRKSSLPQQIPAARPLVPPGFVPPGFTSSIAEKSLGTKSSIHSDSPQVQSSEFEGGLPHVKGTHILNKTSDILSEKQSKNVVEPSILSQQQLRSGSISSTYIDPYNTEIGELDPKRLLGSNIVGESNQAHPAILDKIFGSALTLNGGGSTSSVEHQKDKADETQSPGNVNSSKFARWFFEEERKAVEDKTVRPNDLLSLIQGSESGGVQVSDSASKNATPNLHFQNPEIADMHRTSSLTSGIEKPEQLLNVNAVNNKPAASPAILTCEDLEKSMLSGSSERDPTSFLPALGWSMPNKKSEKQKVNADDQASQRLLSMLQKGTGSGNLGSGSLEKVHSSEIARADMPAHESKGANTEAPSSGKSLTLETLFGNAFMQELQSVGDPAPLQRDPSISARGDAIEPNGFPIPSKDDGLLPSTVHARSNRDDFGTSIFPFTQKEHMKSDGIGDHLLGFEDRRTILGSKLGGFDGPAGIPLPEEDSLIADNLRNFLAVGNSAKAPVDVAGGQNGPRSLRSPYDMREQDIPFHNLNAHAQPPPSQFHRPQLNHAGPFSHAPNMNPQMKFMAQEGIIHQGSPPNHQLPPNMLRPPFHHPSGGLSGFDPPVHPMLQQMHAPGNFPPHLQQGFPGNSSLPHSNNPGARLMQEMNLTQGFPFNHRQPNVPGIGMPPGDVNSMSNHPEALQRLFEMELRSNPKQVHPFGGNGPNRGMQGHELNMGFGFR